MLVLAGIALVALVVAGLDAAGVGRRTISDPDHGDEPITSDAGGYRVTSKPGRFEAWLPGFPSRANRTLSTPYGAVDLHAFSHDGDAISCTASWFERGPLDTRSPRELFDETAKVVTQTYGGSVLAKKDAPLGANAGEEILVSTSTPKVGSVRMRTYLVDRRVYSMTLFMLPGGEVEAAGDRFFDSLVVTDGAGHIAKRAPAPPPTKASLSDVYVSMTQRAPKREARTLLVHEDGTVDLVLGTGAGDPVARRTAKGVADVPKLKKRFESPEWVALSDPPGADPSRATYTIARGNHVIHRSDPLDTSERAFIDAISDLGPLWIHAERAARPGAD